MISNISSAGSPSPFQGGAGDIFLTIYSSGRTSTTSFPPSFDTSGVDAIVAAYNSSAAVVDFSSSRPPQEESSLSAATDALLEVQDRAFAIQDLADISSDPFMADSFREKLQKGVETLVSEIQTIAKTTSFNGERLFDGTPFRVKLGGGSDAFMQAAGIDLQGLAVNLSNLDVTTMRGAFKTYDAIERFTQRVVEIGSRSLNSAEDRIATVKRSLDFISASAAASSPPSFVGGAGGSMNMLSGPLLIQSYQSSAPSSSTSALLSLLA